MLNGKMFSTESFSRAKAAALRSSSVPETQKPFSREATRKFPVPQPTSSRSPECGALGSAMKYLCPGSRGRSLASRPLYINSYHSEVGRTRGLQNCNPHWGQKKSASLPCFSIAGPAAAQSQIGQEAVSGVSEDDSFWPAIKLPAGFTEGLLIRSGATPFHRAPAKDSSRWTK